MADPTAALSPRQPGPESIGDNGIHSSSEASHSVNNGLDSINMRADPDAQATVTDFLDFTEYLPSDITRSLTLIGKLDQTYIDASTKVHELTKDWGQLPLLPNGERPSPVQLRADISETLKHGVSARTYAHAEATRMAENVNQHYNRVKSILTKLQAMKANWPPPEEQPSPVATSKSPQITRVPKPTLRGADGRKIRRHQIPRITVPGEVLAPYEINYDDYSDSSDNGDGAAEEEARQESPPPLGVTPGPQSRIKVVRKEKPPKTPKVPKTPKPKPTFVPSSAVPAGAASAPVPRMQAPRLSVSTSVALAQLKPPPENAVKGSSDAPWLQLTAYELAKLRKRMKKNAAWSPSDTMISRELKLLGRGWEEFKQAKQQAEDEGREFEGRIPSLVPDPETGAMVMPLGALSQQAIAIEERNLNNPRKRASALRKPKVPQPPLSAAEEAEESTRKFQKIARQLMATPSQPPSLPDLSSQAKVAAPAPKSARQRKRKRDSVAEAEAEKPESLEPPPTKKPPAKRTKTETPVPPPQRAPSHLSQETPIPPPKLTAAGTVVIPRTTPIPLPVPAGQDRSARAPSAASPASSINTAVSQAPTTASAAVEPRPRTETPVPLPVPVETKIQTPVLPPVRETRKSIAARKLEEQQLQAQQQQEGEQQEQQAAPYPAAPEPAKEETSTPPSRVPSPTPPVSVFAAVVEPEASASVPAAASTPAPAAPVTRRPASSRGVAVEPREPREQRERRPTSRASKAGSQDLEQPSMAAADRPRRASTARNTPAPDRAEPARPASRRSKRPAPGVISRTNSGGNSAVGRRKAAPKKKSAAAKGSNNNKKDKVGGQQGVVANEAAVAEGEVEVDDDGNPIDPDETRYCICNRVSFGVMIQCENAENGNCKQEWFHLECVGLTEVPARTTKWYCPDCRKTLNIGGRGEVSARGVRT